ncbi:MAG: response regulator [Spirochaetaceae bacterium]|jgi:CheY-like chemotaxis protein|nr:response regulator [Spirochaetaceae bacterium]
MISQVLIADDSYTCRCLITQQLNEILPQAHVNTASNGLDALAIVESQVLDLIICSIELNKLSGLTLLKKLCLLRPKKVIPRVLVMTPFNRKLLRQALKDVKELDFLDKPVDKNELKKKLLGEVNYG